MIALTILGLSALAFLFHYLVLCIAKYGMGAAKVCPGFLEFYSAVIARRATGFLAASADASQVTGRSGKEFHDDGGG